MNKFEQNMQDRLGINILKAKTTNHCRDDNRSPEIMIINRDTRRTIPASIHLDEKHGS